MTVYTARTAGFCAGVARAVNTVNREAAQQKLVTYGPLINNRIVTDELAAKGVRIIHDLNEVRDETVVLRAHGVPPSVEAELKRRGIPYIDCTCHDVKAIQGYVEKARVEGHTLIILGEASHPEVVSYTIPGAIIATDENDPALAALDTLTPYTLVAQTTFSRERYDVIVRMLKGRGLNLTVHDTICDATSRRQAEAAELAKQMDVMLVLGDKHSANTNRLYEICRRYCERTVLLASIKDLQLRNLHADDKIGVTAGASTPPAITKEAILFMSDLANEQIQPEAQALPEPETHAAPAQPDTQPETVAEPVKAQPPKASASPSFEEMLNESLLTLHTGDIVKSTVIHVSNSEITVNLGYKSDGIITKAEMTEDSTADITQMVKPGDVMDVYVLRVNDGDGNVLVSKKRLDAQTNYKLIEQAFNDKTPIAGKVTEIVKGGMIAMVNGCRVFVPSSQASNRFVEDLNVFKGKEMNFIILEFDRSKRRIVAGRKELATIEQQQRREELYASLEVGQRMNGTVSRIVDFGAFIDLGGVDGLVHISELAWRRVRKVTDVLKVGDAVTVTVIDVNPEKNKISLSLKDVHNNPWNDIAEKYPIGSIVEGKVVRMASFGAFVMLEDGVDGLVHISQIAEHHVAKPEDELTVGQMIYVKVTDIDEESHKISLSKREADVDAYDDDYDDYDDTDDALAGPEAPDVDELAVSDEVFEASDALEDGEDTPENA